MRTNTMIIKVLHPSLYGNIIIGVLGIIPQRQFIMEQFPEGAHLVFLDDDVDNIDLSLSEVADDTLDNFIREAFKTTRERRAFIWCLSCIQSIFFATVASMSLNA